MIVLSCLLWYLWREKNDRNFEDRKRTLKKIKSLFFFNLYLWTIALVYLLVTSYHDFLVLFSPSIYVFSHVYTSCVPRGALRF
jgi:hypothetical protein